MQPNQYPQNPDQGWQPQPQPPQPQQPAYQDPYATLTPPSATSPYPQETPYQPQPPQPQPMYGQQPAYQQPVSPAPAQYPYPEQSYPQQPQAPQPYPEQLQARSLEPPYAHYDDPAPRGQRPPSDFELRFREHVQSSIAEPPKRKMKIWPLVLGLLLLLVLGGGGAAAYYILQNQQPTAEERFQYAITAHLQTPYVNQDYDMHLDMDDVTADFKIKSSMNITDPSSPKLSASYTLSSNKTPDYTMNFVTTSRTKAYMSYDEAKTLSDSGIKPKTWYSYDPSDSIVALAVDPFGMISHIGTARGEFPVGKFSEQQQATIMSQINSASPYTITTVTEENTAIRYDLTINSDNFKKLDTVVAKLVGEDSDSISDAAKGDTTMQVWIDKQTNRIVKASQKKDKNTMTVTITYPAQYDGAAPKDSLDLMNALQANTTDTATKPQA